MEYLHAKRTVHFDLKSDNVLAAVRGRRLVCKVCDLVYPNVTSFASLVRIRRQLSPRHVAALDRARSLQQSPDKVTESADVYSLAIVMWELWTSQLPHYGLDEYASVTADSMMHQLRPTVPAITRYRLERDPVSRGD